MKAGYRAIERALETPGASRCAAPSPRVPADDFDWQARARAVAIPVPALLELQERFGGRRVLLTGGGGSIGRELTSLPARLPARARHDARRSRGLADRRPPRARRPRRSSTSHTCSATSATASGSRASWRARAPTSSSTSPPTSTSTGPRSTPTSSSTTTCTAAGRPARGGGGRRRDGRRRLDRQGRARGELLRPHEALHGAAHGVRGPRAGGERIAVRFVNVLGSAGSASELFLAAGPRERAADGHRHRA